MTRSDYDNLTWEWCRFKSRNNEFCTTYHCKEIEGLYKTHHKILTFRGVKKVVDVWKYKGEEYRQLKKLLEIL